MDRGVVRVEIYRSFIERGRAPVAADLAAQLGSSVEEVEDALALLAEEDIIALMPGTRLIWLAHPFCASHAGFTVTSGGRTWDAICIWDAVGILAVLESDGGVATRCPDCAEELRVTVSDGSIASADDVVVHYGVPASRWYEDVGHT